MDLTKDYEHYKFIADSGQSPLRVDKFLLNFIKYASRNKIQQAAENGNIKVNGVSVKSSHKVKSGDGSKMSETQDLLFRKYDAQMPAKVKINIKSRNRWSTGEGILNFKPIFYIGLYDHIK